MSLRKLKWRGIGRLELLAWLNEFLETDYTKIEHLADGIAYCQIFDALYPGKVNLQQLNFHARTEMEYERNLKVLRRTFHLCDIRKEIPIRKLVQGIFQEHFEFLHWIHDYVHRTCPDAVRSYHGFERRQEALGQSLFQSPIHAANTNLIPKYSNSMKTPRELFIEGETLDSNETLGGEVSLTSEIIEDQSVVEAASDDEELDYMDHSLQFVRHSFRSTIRSKFALAKLEEAIESARVVASKPKMSSKRESSRLSKVRQETTNDVRKSKSKTALTFEDPAEPDPMICRCISELLEGLESELLGRVKDLQYLEKNIEALVAVEPSQHSE